jgi:hypothetical protein
MISAICLLTALSAVVAGAPHGAVTSINYELIVSNDPNYPNWIQIAQEQDTFDGIIAVGPCGQDGTSGNGCSLVQDFKPITWSWTHSGPEDPDSWGE